MGAYEEHVLADSPTYYWPLDDPSTSFRNLGSGSLTTPLASGAGTPTYRAVGPNRRRAFHSTALNIHNSPNSPDASAMCAGSYSYEIWAATTGVIQALFGNWDTNGTMIYSNPVIVYHESGNVATGITHPTDGTWHHWCVTWNGTTQLVYYDGALVATRAVSTTVGSATRLQIGEYNYDTAPYSTNTAVCHAAWFTGTVLTPTRIAERVALMRRTWGVYPSIVMASANLGGYWPLDETVATAGATGLGPAANGGYVNAPTVGQSGPSYNLPVAADFDGTNDHVEVPDDTAIEAGGDITLEIWAKRDGTSSDTLFDKTNGTSANSSYFAYFTSATSIRFQYGSGAGSPFVDVTVPASTNWHHWVFVGEPAGSPRLRVYRDGVFMGGASPSLGTPAANALVLRIGNFISNADHFDGQLAHAAIYKRVLTAKEIMEHYRVGLMGSAGITVY